MVQIAALSKRAPPSSSLALTERSAAFRYQIRSVLAGRAEKTAEKQRGDWPAAKAQPLQGHWQNKARMVQKGPRPCEPNKLLRHFAGSDVLDRDGRGAEQHLHLTSKQIIHSLQALRLDKAHEPC
jgi:hypothetical protein